MEPIDILSVVVIQKSLFIEKTGKDRVTHVHLHSKSWIREPFLTLFSPASGYPSRNTKLSSYILLGNYVYIFGIRICPAPVKILAVPALLSDGQHRYLDHTCEHTL